MSLFDRFKKRRPPQASAEPVATTTSQLVHAWRQIILEDHKSWVLFRHGTCVILTDPVEADLRVQATKLLREWGPVHAGSPAGDFTAVQLAKHPGWVVTCHHDNILTYVASEEAPSDEQSDLFVGLLGRSKRDQDASALEIIHVENKHHVA